MIKKRILHSWRARAHTRCLPPLRVPYQALYRFNYSPLLSPPAWLFGPHHSPQSKPVFIKLLWNVGKADTEEVGVYLGGAKYFIALSIAHCDWVVYAVNAGDKPMGHWLLVVPAWWSLAKKINKSVGPFSASAHRENARLPVQPWLLRIIAAFLLAQLPSLHSGAHSFLPNQNLTSESAQSVIVVKCRLYCC